MEIGNTIKIGEEYSKHLDSIKEELNTFRNMEIDGSRGVKDSSKKLWEFINELFPEVEEFHVSLNHETNEILIIGRK